MNFEGENRAMNELGQAFSKVMKELSEISFKKDAFNDGKKNSYITLDAINKQLLPILEKNGLAFIVNRDEHQNFQGTLLHCTSMQEYTKGFGKIELETRGINKDGREYERMNEAQAQGATLSYGRRYVTSCFFNLVVDEDNDAESRKNTKSSGHNQAQSISSNQQGDFQKVDNFNDSTVQISVIDIIKPTQKGDKMICSVKTVDKKSTLAYPDITKNGVKLSEWDLRFECLKNLIRFGKNMTIKISSKVQNDFGINPQSASVLLEEARKKGHTLILQGINDQQPSLPTDFATAPPVGSPEYDNIPF